MLADMLFVLVVNVPTLVVPPDNKDKVPPPVLELFCINKENWETARALFADFFNDIKKIDSCR